MANQKKRTALSVQDVVAGPSSGNSRVKAKSGYSGPKKSTSRVMEQVNLYLQDLLKDLKVY